MTETKYLIDPYIPANGVHVLIGSSGTGKTTLLMQLLDQTDVPFAYICGDRTEQAYKESIERIGIKSFPIYSIIDETARAMARGGLKAGSWHKWVANYIESLATRPEIIIFDPASLAMPGVTNFNDYKQIAKALVDLQAEAQVKQQTYILIHHTNKTKRSEDFFDPFNRVSGSHAWIAYSNTKGLLMTDQEDAEGPCLYLKGQNFPENKILLFKDAKGRFSVRDADSESESQSTILKCFKDYEPCATSYIIENAEVSRATVFRLLGKLVDLGIIEKAGHGQYRRVRIS